MKQLTKALLLITIIFTSCKEENNQKVYVPNVNNLYLTSNAQSRSISGENLSGGKGQGGKIKPSEGNAKTNATKHGWKANPYVFVKPNEEKVLADIDGSGVINHIWMTPGRDGNDKLRILKFYWDGEKEPSVEVPLGDFFCNAWNSINQTDINSAVVIVNPLNGFNSFWQMPFKKKCKITLTNLTKSRTTLYYQVDYTLMDLPDNVAYFHAQYRRVKKVPFKKEYVIVDNIKGHGQYVGTFIARGTHSKKWWGEGEVQMFIDGDTDHATYHGTGEEDYFLGSYAYKKFENKGWDKWKYVPYNTAYSGFHVAEHHEGYEGCFGQYRWHIMDPIRFKEDFKIQIQILGWKGSDYYPLEDDVQSVAFWYQTEPHQPFPKLPNKKTLDVQFKN
jgi:hypothetical protein